jgi:hypothetical protein
MPPAKLNGRASPILINLALGGYVALELAAIIYIISRVIRGHLEGEVNARNRLRLGKP